MEAAGINDTELSALVAEEFAESLQRAQAMGLGANFVLTEIVRDRADASAPDARGSCRCLETGGCVFGRNVGHPEPHVLSASLPARR
jgi:hypothetical protein